MIELQTYTCVQFVPRGKQKNFVYIYNGDGCSSYVGQTGGQQDISIMISGPGDTTCLKVRMKNSFSKRDFYWPLPKVNIIIDNWEVAIHLFQCWHIGLMIS